MSELEEIEALLEEAYRQFAKANYKSEPERTRLMAIHEGRWKVLDVWRELLRDGNSLPDVKSLRRGIRVGWGVVAALRKLQVNQPAVEWKAEGKALEMRHRLRALKGWTPLPDDYRLTGPEWQRTLEEDRNPDFSGEVRCLGKYLAKFERALPLILEMRAGGFTLAVIARRLNNDGMTTPGGSIFRASTISVILRQHETFQRLRARCAA